MAESDNPRSVHGKIPTYVAFTNKSDRSVNLFWINYKGELVSYGVIAPRLRSHMDTFETHPWVARDADTGYPLLLNGEKVFFPKAERNGKQFTHEERDIVSIMIPAYSLYRRTLEVLHNHVPPETTDTASLTNEMQEALTRMRTKSWHRDSSSIMLTMYKDIPEIKVERHWFKPFLNKVFSSK